MNHSLLKSICQKEIGVYHSYTLIMQPIKNWVCEENREIYKNNKMMIHERVSLKLV